MNLAKDFGLEWENLKTHLRIGNDICIALSHTLVYTHTHTHRYIETYHLFKCHLL